MTVDPRALAASVAALTREEAIEAALAMAEEIVGPDAHPGSGVWPEAAATFAGEVEESPYAHLPEVDDIARALLIVAGAGEEWGPQVSEVLAGVGRKALVFGAAEIVALAGLGVLALALVLSKGRSREKETIEFHEDGKLVYERETVYATGPKLIEQLAKIITGFRQP